MRVLVDLLPLMPRGGGLQNALNLWRAVREHGGAHRWLAVARPELGLPADGNGHAGVRMVSPAGLGRRLAYENGAMGTLARRWSADVVWTPMGAGPLRAPVPRVLGWHDSTVVYPGVAGRGLPVHRRVEEALRGRVARAAARGAAALTVQTETMKGRLAAAWDIPLERFHVVPNGPSAFLAGERPQDAPPERPTILVVAEAKPAKNLEIVPFVARALREGGHPDARVVITVPEKGGAYTEPFHRALEAAGPLGSVECVGRVPHAHIGALYRSASVVFLPSLCESFSATYLEAMHFGVPLVTSDRDFARDLCGEAALYADPEDPAECAAALAQVLDGPGIRDRLRREGFVGIRRFPDWEERLRLYIEALESALRPDRAELPEAVEVGR